MSRDEREARESAEKSYNDINKIIIFGTIVKRYSTCNNFSFVDSARVFEYNS